MQWIEMQHSIKTPAELFVYISFDCVHAFSTQLSFKQQTNHTSQAKTYRCIRNAHIRTRFSK